MEFPTNHFPCSTDALAQNSPTKVLANGTETSKVQLCGFGAKVFWGVSESRKLRQSITVISLLMSNIISIPQHGMINSLRDYSFCLAWVFIKLLSRGKALPSERPCLEGSAQGSCQPNQIPILLALIIINVSSNYQYTQEKIT